VAKKEGIVVTSACRLVFPHLHAADTKFDKAGVYSTKGAFAPGADRDSLVTLLENALAESEAEAKKKNPGKKIKVADLPWSEEMSGRGEDATPTGALLFNFKLKASGKTREGVEFTQAPKLYDSKGNLLPAGTKIGGGTIAKIAFEINKFYTATVGAGVSLRLKAVQILDLKTWEGASAETYGFGTEEGFERDSFAKETGDTADAPETKDAKDSSDF
jgi:hypothetical protein